ncbi:lysozyme family protein [Virgibacillus byunsanensis]|uniref:Lysozyme family protein n=1 Tax=Virgibacillus byunsanensis TaxID=570945 RepID=A0ABW3LIG7_9BACI
MKPKTKKAIKQSLFIGVMLCAVFVAVSLLSATKTDQTFQVSHTSISDEVIGYELLVEKYAKKYNVTAHTDVLLAMMMQESGGRGNDPMQSSESYCGERGCINDPEHSIRQGVYYFSETLDAAGGDLELAIQSYNFGKGFIDYVKEQSGSYSQEVAIDFSQKMYQNASNQSDYRCLREEAKQYNACYGDIYYVRDVMEYRNVLAME